MAMYRNAGICTGQQTGVLGWYRELQGRTKNADDMKAKNISGCDAGSHAMPWRMAVAAAVLCLGLIAPNWMARAQNTYVDRDTVRRKLNQAMVQLAMPANDTVAIHLSDIDTLNLLGLSGECAKLYTDTLILMVRNDSNVTMEVTLEPASIMSVPPNSHDMVCDLELAWLKRSWGYTMRDSIGSYPIAWDSPCRTGVHFDQAYFMGTFVGINGGGNERARDTLEEWLAEWRITSTQYHVVTNGTTLVESDVATRAYMPRTNDSADDLPYIVQRHSGAGANRDTAWAKPAYTRVQFYPSVAPTSGKIVTEVEIEARTRAYSPTDCSPTSGTGVLAPRADSAFVRITFHTKDLDNANALATEYIWRKFATGSIAQDNADLWTFFDQANQYVVDSWCKFEIDADGYLYFKAESSGGDHQCTAPGTYRIMRLRSPLVPARMCTFGCVLGSTFELDTMTAEMYCKHGGASGATQREIVPCLEFCTRLSGYRTMNNVLAASAQRMENTWTYDTADFIVPKVLTTWPLENTSNNAYELGQGTWRPLEAYAYRTGTKPGGKLANNAERVYDSAGIFVNDTGGTVDAFRVFDWRNPDANTGTKWLRASTVTAFSPFGDPLEERDVLGLYSTAKYAHANTVPRLVAQNARYSSVGYESFEDGMGDIDTIAHSGRWSLRLTKNNQTVMRLIVDQQMRSKGVVVRLWAKRTYQNFNSTDTAVAIDAEFGTGVLATVAQTGEWTLYERVCDLGGATLGDTIELKVKSRLWPPANSSPDDEVWLDDIRAQPFDAEMICYAYDANTLRLLAKFDDQHFGAYYQYNGEGKLVRTLRETERGMKTVAETQYHTPDMYTRDGTLLSHTQMSGGPSMRTSADHRSGGQDTPQEAGATGQPTRIDLLDASLGADGFTWGLFGGKKPDLSVLDPDSLRALIVVDTAGLQPEQMERLRDAGLDDMQRLKDVMEARELDRRITALAEREKEELGAEERRYLEAARARLNERRRELLRDRLGISEEELRDLYRALESEGKEE